MLDWSNFTEDHLHEAINKVVENRDIGDAIGKMSELFRDQKEHPVERAVWWIEYIMRHNGAPFLKPKSMDMEWYEYNLMDVIIFLLSIWFIIAVIFIKCCTCIAKRVIISHSKSKIQ